MKPIHQLQNLIQEIATHIIMPYYLKVATVRKTDGSLLSEADLAAQAAFQSKLPEIIPAPVLGEEMPFEMQQQLWQSAQSGLWVLDPIDGTNNFVNGIPHFAISVAYIQQGRSQLGVIYQPISQECYTAERGQGAFLNQQRLPKQHHTKCLHEAIAGVDVKRLRLAKLVSSINNFAPFGTLRCMGSSTLDWCYLATGRYDIYLHGGQNLWDYAAGALIAEEAGISITTLEGDDFWSGKHTFQRSVIAATEPLLFNKWLHWIRTNQR